MIIFEDVIADILSNKNLIRGRKLNISLVFNTQSYFSLPTDITLNYTQYVIIKIPNKKELQQVAFNHSSDI